MARTIATRAKKTARDKQRFLDAYLTRGTIVGTCLLTKIGRSTVQDWTSQDPAFAAALEQADRDAPDFIKAQVYKRAIDDQDTPALLALARAICPDFKAAGRLTGFGLPEPQAGASVTATLTQTLRVEVLSDAELKLLDGLLRKVGIAGVSVPALDAGEPEPHGD